MPNVVVIAGPNGAGKSTAAPQIADEGVWLMIERQAKAREREERYEAGLGGVMGVPFEQIMEALREAGREARRRHKALGHPIVIWRDGRVVEVPPEEIEVD